MSKVFHKRVMRLVASVKKAIQRQPGFIENAKLRALYVIVCTIEGAIMFGDLEALAKHCAIFCKEQVDEVGLSN